MARLDATAIWFQRGDDVEAMAATETIDKERVRLPTLAWVGAAVALSAVGLFVAVQLEARAAAARQSVAAPAAAAPSTRR
jgi:hypothetical protein